MGSLQEEIEVRDPVGHDQEHEGPRRDEGQDEAEQRHPGQLVDVHLQHVMFRCPPPGREGQIWMASPIVAAAASITASLSVGWAWIVWWISSTEASRVMASPYSAMSSVASEPMMCAP